MESLEIAKDFISLRLFSFKINSPVVLSKALSYTSFSKKHLSANVNSE